MAHFCKISAKRRFVAVARRDVRSWLKSSILRSRLRFDVSRGWCRARTAAYKASAYPVAVLRKRRPNERVEIVAPNCGDQRHNLGLFVWIVAACQLCIKCYELVEHVALRIGIHRDEDDLFEGRVLRNTISLCSLPQLCGGVMCLRGGLTLTNENRVQISKMHQRRAAYVGPHIMSMCRHDITMMGRTLRPSTMLFWSMHTCTQAKRNSEVDVIT